MQKQFNERLRMALRQANKKQTELAKACGVSRAAVTRWLDGSVTSFSRASYAIAASQFLGVSLNWLAEGKGEMFSNGIRAYDTKEKEPSNVVGIPEYRLFFGAAQEGKESPPEWEIVEDSDIFWYKLDFFQKRKINPDHCKRAKVVGDSMEPFIYSGDTVLFVEQADPRPGTVHIQDGKIYVISIDYQLKIKRLSTIKNGIAVRSDNAEYKTEEFLGVDINRLRIFGKVIEVTRAI